MVIARNDTDDPALIWRELEPDDLDAVYALHIAATDAVGAPSLIRPETRDFFEAILAGGGRIAGVFDTAGLLAYGVLQWDLPPVEDLRPLFGLPPDAPFAKLAGASVRPGMWGGGLHENMIARRIVMARDLGLTHLYATSAPGNARSWENLLNCGFEVRALIEQYGGNLRYVVYRGLVRDAGRDAAPGPAHDPARDEDGTWCDTDDAARQRQLVDMGMTGASWRRRDDGRREICWVKRA